MKLFLKKLLTAHLFLDILIGMLSGGLLFLCVYDARTLPITSLDWIYQQGGDLFQHQIGWEFFRQESWHFPLGRIDTYGYPFGSNVSYTDSIPLFAYLFKLILGQQGLAIQYLGLWELTSLIMQCIFGMLIFNEFTSSVSIKVAGSMLLTLSPVLLYRAFEHNSLTAQWLLLAGIYLVIRSYKVKQWRGAWMLLFALAMLIHLYFVAMLVPLWLVSLLFRVRNKEKIKPLALEAIVTAASTLLIGYAMGLFSLSIGNLLAEGFGQFSWNLNGFINPQKYSAFLPQLPVEEGQYEGFSYLGLGNLVLIATGLVLFIWKERSRRVFLFVIILAAISVGYMFFALSNRAYSGVNILWDFPLPKKIEIMTAFFRASGRFIWPVFYLVVLFGSINVIRGIRKQYFAVIILLLSLGIQYVDLQPLIRERKEVVNEEYLSPLCSPFWEEAAQTYQHLMLLPAAKAHAVYEPFAIYARQNQLTLNWGYFARANLGGIRDYGDQEWEALQAGHAKDDTFYVLWRSEEADIAQRGLPGGLIVCQVDGYTVVLSAKDPSAWLDWCTTR